MASQFTYQYLSLNTMYDVVYENKMNVAKVEWKDQIIVIQKNSGNFLVRETTPGIESHFLYEDQRASQRSCLSPLCINMYR